MVWELLRQINYWAVLVSAIVFWVIGMLWFSAIVGKKWASATARHGIKIGRPTKKRMIEKSIWTFLMNWVVCFGVAILAQGLGVYTFGAALGLGIVLGLCIAAAVMATSYIWENRSFELSFYDIFYPFIGIIVASLIIGLWR